MPTSHPIFKIVDPIKVEEFLQYQTKETLARLGQCLENEYYGIVFIKQYFRDINELDEWIRTKAVHLTKRVGDQYQDYLVKHSLDPDNPYLSSQLIMSGEEFEYIYYDQFGNTVGKDELGYFKNIYFKRGYFAPGVKSRVAKAAGLMSHVPCYNDIMNAYMQHLTQLKEEELRYRNPARYNGYQP